MMHAKKMAMFDEILAVEQAVMRLVDDVDDMSPGLLAQGVVDKLHDVFASLYATVARAREPIVGEKNDDWERPHTGHSGF